MTDASLAPVDEVWLDDETAGLRIDDDVWEHALVRVSGRTGKLTQYVWHLIDFDPSNADPKALEFGHFYERHPMHVILDPEDPLRRAPTEDERMMHPALAVHGPDLDLPVEHKLCARATFVDEFERLVRGAVVWACNPTFDVNGLSRVLAHDSLLPFQRRQFSAHYRPLDATTYAASAATALGIDVGPFPWINREVGAAIGVSRDGYGQAHTALADAHYARELVLKTRALVAAAQVAA